MTKKNIKKIIIWSTAAIFGGIFINTCMMTKIPDKIERIYEIEPIKTYKFYQKDDGEYYSIEYGVVPNQPLNILFYPSIFWPANNDDRLYIRGDLFSENKNEALYIKEISYNYKGKNTVIIKNRHITIPMDLYDILLDENREPAIIDGKILYAIWITHGYFFDWGVEMEFDFSPKRFGQEKEIELVQIYSFDNKTWFEEKYKYKVICGGRKFDINRPILNIAGLYL
jgi:hypothetical protein